MIAKHVNPSDKQTFDEVINDIKNAIENPSEEEKTSLEMTETELEEMIKKYISHELMQKWAGD